MSHVLRMTQQQLDALRNKHRKPYTKAHEPKEQADGWPIVLRDQIVAAGLPEPFREFTFHETRGWRQDLSWPSLMRAVEVDGGVHVVRKQWAKDLEKHNALMLAGWRYLRVTPAMVRDGSALEFVKVFIA